MLTPPTAPSIFELDLKLIDSETETKNLFAGFDEALRKENEQERLRRIAELHRLQSDRKLASFDWHGWYQSLAIIFPRPKPSGWTEGSLGSAISSIAVAAGILMAAWTVHDWRLWLLCVALVLITIVYDFFVAVNYIKDLDGRYYQIAGMLKELKARGNP